MSKKRNPKEEIESTPNPRIEHSFIKYPGEEMIEVTDYNRAKKHHSAVNQDKYFKARKAHGVNTRFLQSHTHPSDDLTPGFLNRIIGRVLYGIRKKDWKDAKEMVALPSYGDLKSLLRERRMKSTVIAVRNPKTGEVLGYHVLRKTKANIKKYASFLKINDQYGRQDSEPWDNDLETYETERLESIGSKNYGVARQAFEKLAKRYHIQSRLVPSKNYQVNESKTGFIAKQKSLESKVEATTAIVGLLGSIIFLSSNFTGNAIGNISRSSSNWMGVVLFLVGVAGGLFYFRRKFSKRTK